MTYDNSRLNREIGRYLESRRHEGLSEKYVREQERLLRHFRIFCGGQGVNAPTRVTLELLRTWVLRFDYMSVVYQKHILVALRSFLKFAGRPLALEVRVKLRGTSRSHIRWVSNERLANIFASPMRPQTAVMVHLGFLMLLRRCEIVRVRWDEAEEALRSNYLGIHGKGFKPRQVQLHPDVREVLLEYMKTDPKRKDPELLLGFGPSRADDLLQEFWRSNQLVRFSFHDMRRTGAANYFEAKDEHGNSSVPVAVISKMMGHKDEAQTLEYIGIDLRQQEKAMECVRVSKIVSFKTGPSDPLLDRGVILEAPGL